MVEREKVIRGLECWLNDDTHCPDDDCPYMGPLICDQTAILNDAITILKAHDVPETNVGKWISVKDRLPEEGVLVLVAFDVDFGLGETRTVDTAMRQESVFCGGGLDNYLAFPCEVDVTHWMPLPEPPKEGT